MCQLLIHLFFCHVFAQWRCPPELRALGCPSPLHPSVHQAQYPKGYLLSSKYCLYHLQAPLLSYPCPPNSAEQSTNVNPNFGHGFTIGDVSNLSISNLILTQPKQCLIKCSTQVDPLSSYQVNHHQLLLFGLHYCSVNNGGFLIGCQEGVRRPSLAEGGSLGAKGVKFLFHNNAAWVG